MSETSGRSNNPILLLAVVAVVVALLIVAWQIRQNTAALRTESNLRVTSMLGGAAPAWAQDPEFATLMARVRDEPASLSGAERVRFEAYGIGLFNLWEQGFLVREEGLMREPVWEDWNGRMRTVAAQPALRALWPQVNTYYSTPFQAHVDQEFQAATIPPAQ